MVKHYLSKPILDLDKLSDSFIQAGIPVLFIGIFNHLLERHVTSNNRHTFLCSRNRSVQQISVKKLPRACQKRYDNCRILTSL